MVCAILNRGRITHFEGTTTPIHILVPSLRPNSRARAQALSWPRAALFCSIEGLRHVTKTSTQPPYPVKGAGCRVGHGSRNDPSRPAPTQPLGPAPLRLSRCPRVGCGVWASHYTTVTLSYHISQRKRFNKSQPVWKNDTQIKQALLPAAIWGWWWCFFFFNIAI